MFRSSHSSHSGRNHRTTRRVALTAAALSLAVAAPVAAAQAKGGAHPAPQQHPHAVPAAAKAAPVIASGSPTSASARVGDFYGAYIDAVWDGGTSTLAQQLRSHYLTVGLRKKLAAWEKKEHADGVLRAQDVPTAWRVSYDGSGAGHAWTTVRLTWGSPKHPVYTTLKVQSDLASRKISDIK